MKLEQPSDILYGETPVRSATTPSIEKRVLSNGAVEYYDQLGELFKVTTPAGITYNYPWDPKPYGLVSFACTMHIKDQQLHREDGPALEHDNGTKEWYQQGLCHRGDGPAIEYCDGSTEYWIHGKRHREDGPAIDMARTAKAFYLDNQHYINKRAWLDELKKRNKP